MVVNSLLHHVGGLKRGAFLSWGFVLQLAPKLTGLVVENLILIGTDRKGAFAKVAAIFLYDIFLRMFPDN